MRKLTAIILALVLALSLSAALAEPTWRLCPWA